MAGFCIFLGDPDSLHFFVRCAAVILRERTAGAIICRMPPPLSRRLGELSPSGTMAMRAAAESRRAAGLPVFDLTAGEPDFRTPLTARLGAQEALREDKTRYTPVAGIPELRTALAAEATHLAGGGARYSSENIFVSAGAKAVLHQLFLALLSPAAEFADRDEVLIPTPCWTSYPEQVKLAGGTPVFVDTVATGWWPDPERLAAALTPRTRALVICHPNNPTGAVIPPERLQALAEFCKAREIWLLCDEVYLDFSYGAPACSSLRYAWAGLIVVSAASKSYAMTGWRLGWAVAQPELIAALTLLQSQTLTCASSLSQWAALRALTGDRGYLAQWRGEYQKRCKRLLSALAGIPGLRWAPPDGAFYLFLDCREILARRGESSAQFAARLLSQFGVGVVPGEAFLAPGFLRISYAAADDILDSGALLLRAALSD